MGHHIDPDIVQPTPGHVLVQIIEILGGLTRGGVWVPGEKLDHMGKDTFYGQVIKVGPPPFVSTTPRVVKHQGATPTRPEPNGHTSGVRWPQEFLDQVKVGDVVVFPRDVPLAFTWDEKRYCLCRVEEAILSIDSEGFDSRDLEIVPWRAPSP